MRTIETYVAEATAAYEAGFTSKAGQKRAFEALGRAYSILRDRAHDAICKAAPFNRLDRDLTASEWETRGAYFAARDMPFDLHNVRARHIDLMAQYGVEAAEVTQLVELRAAIKAAPVVKIERSTETERVVKVREGILDMMKRRGEQYNRALAVADIFNGLPVHANVHLCVNEHGTQYVRAFFYLAGEFTPLNVILAAADELARRKDAGQ